MIKATGMPMPSVMGMPMTVCTGTSTIGKHASWMDSEGPGGQIWSQLPLIGLPGLESLYNTHFGLVLDLFLAPRGPKRARFGPKGPFWGSWRDS